MAILRPNILCERCVVPPAEIDRLRREVSGIIIIIMIIIRNKKASLFIHHGGSRHSPRHLPLHFRISDLIEPLKNFVLYTRLRLFPISKDGVFFPKTDVFAVLLLAHSLARVALQLGVGVCKVSQYGSRVVDGYA